MTVSVQPADITERSITELLHLAVGGARSRLARVVQYYGDNPAATLLSAIADDEVAGVAGSGRGPGDLRKSVERGGQRQAGRRVVEWFRVCSPPRVAFTSVGSWRT